MAEPLIFLPGLMCDARLFGPQIAAMSANLAVTVAPVTQGERIEEIASGLLDLLPRRFAMAGHGMGGAVAMEILRRAPNRISRLALISTHPLAETPQAAAEREPRLVRARAGRLREIYTEELPIDCLAPTPYRTEVYELALDMAEALGAETFIRQARALQRRRDQTTTLCNCKVPTLVLCGRHDGSCPVKRHESMAELVPYATLKVIEDAGALPTLEQPDEATSILMEWLKQPLVLR